MIEEIQKELVNFFENLFGRDYFTIIYGSYSYGVNTSKSDLDFMTACKSYDQQTLKEVIRFVFDLYNRFELAFDDEVPHENKLLVGYDSLDAAIQGRGFEVRDRQIYVPPVIKTKEFLHSNEIALRLALNAITSKNIFVSGDQDYYSSKRQEALEKMVGIMFSVNRWASVNIDEFVQALIGSPERNGEMYLGYKDKPAVRTYLTDTYNQVLSAMTKIGYLAYHNKRFHLTNRSWLDNFIMEAK